MTLKPRATNSAAAGSRSPMFPESRSNSTSTGALASPVNHQPLTSAPSRVDLKETADHASPVDAGRATNLSDGVTANAGGAKRPAIAHASASHVSRCTTRHAGELPPSRPAVTPAPVGATVPHAPRPAESCRWRAGPHGSRAGGSVAQGAAALRSA